jgi:hypothetical protein
MFYKYGGSIGLPYYNSGVCAFGLALALCLWVIMARVSGGLVVVITTLGVVLSCRRIHNKEPYSKLCRGRCKVDGVRNSS